MAKFAILLSIVLAAILPNTNGDEVELPTLALEYLEDLKPLLPKTKQLMDACMSASSSEAEDEDKCLENGTENDADLSALKDKFDRLTEALTEDQFSELEDRIFTLFQEHANELPPIALECFEDIKKLYPKMVKLDSECRDKSTTEDGTLDSDEYDKCQETAQSEPELVAYSQKCEPVQKAFTSRQREEFANLYEKFESEQEVRLENH